MSGTIRFHGNSIHDFPDSMERFQEADKVINRSGVVLKDRHGSTGRRATAKELKEAVWIEDIEDAPHD